MTALIRFVRAVIVTVVTLGLFSVSTAGEDHQDLDAFFDRPYDEAYEKQMVGRIHDQIDRYFDRLRERVVASRGDQWRRDFSSWSEYRTSVEPNRQHLRGIVGLVDERQPGGMEQFGTIDANSSGVLARTSAYTVHQVRWPVLEDVWGEGLLLEPRHTVANVVTLPDADQLPEQLAGLVPMNGTLAESFAQRLAERGIRVVVPVLLSRDCDYSGTPNAVPNRHWQDAHDKLQPTWTNMSHREWVYRQAYVMGRHIIGLEVQKTLAAVDWFKELDSDLPVGVAGYGEGGLIALYAAALDDRIDAALVSGYFGPRAQLHEEPVYRNVWGLLTEFGDAEIASLIAPRSLTVEYSPVPEATRPADADRRKAASDGRLVTPDFDAVEQEVLRGRGLFRGELVPDISVVHGDNRPLVHVGSPDALRSLVRGLGLDDRPVPSSEVQRLSALPDASARQERQVRQIERHLMEDVHELADFRRYRFLNGDDSSPEAWDVSMGKYRDYLYDEVIGRLPEELPPPNARQRKVFDEEHWIGYEVVLDVLPGVVGWGLLAVPKDVREDVRRPVVVVQHGHAGTPTTPWRVRSYNEILPKLCQRGFIVFAPYAPYQFDVRQATPLKASVYSILIPLHQQIVRWLATLDQVAGDRIAFYGKSWGGRSALRIPPFVPEYRAVVCSAYFNQWPRKAITPHYQLSYQYTGSIGVYEFDQGNTFGHAELAMLIAPRPFLVESGYNDPVMPAEWSAYEFAKVKRLYDQLGIGDWAVFGAHIGGHEVHDDTILPFLHRHLQWPVGPVR